MKIARVNGFCISSKFYMVEYKDLFGEDMNNPTIYDGRIILNTVSGTFNNPKSWGSFFFVQTQEKYDTKIKNLSFLNLLN